MENALSIFNKILNKSALVNSSSVYYETENILIRFSNHKANISNLSFFEQENKNILFVYVNSELTEFEMQENISEIQNSDYLFFNDGDDLEILKLMIDRFIQLNN